jgi:hypothetical protein
MTERSLQVTYRKGKPFSAYLHLSHQTGEKSARTVPSADGLLVVDHGHNGKAIGVEITASSGVPLERLNRILADLGTSGIIAPSFGRSRCALSEAITRLIMPLCSAPSAILQLRDGQKVGAGFAYPRGCVCPESQQSTT